MTKKPKKLNEPEAMPIEMLFKDERFMKHFKWEIRRNPDSPLLDGVLPLLFDGAAKDWERKGMQQSKSVKPRPKKNERGSRDDVIHALVRRYPGEQPSALWLHFRDALAEWSRDELNDEVHDTGTAYTHWIGNTKYQITFTTFAKKVSAYRRKIGI